MQVGSDGGRHGWFKWANGPVPEGKSLTQSISLYDCTMVTMKSLVGTPSFDWTEENPNSDRITRVLGRFANSCYKLTSYEIFLVGVIMAEEGDQVLANALLWIQRQQELLRDGFSIENNNEEYTFLPEYIDR